MAESGKESFCRLNYAIRMQIIAKLHPKSIRKNHYNLID
jgi:hypothetical protein